MAAILRLCPLSYDRRKYTGALCIRIPRLVWRLYSSQIYLGRTLLITVFLLSRRILTRGRHLKHREH